MTERFTLLSELGRGGMGVVWKARDEETGQIVALKLLREAYAEDPEYLARFERELELAKRIHSAHVVEVLGYGARDGTPYLALEYVDGPSLRELLATHGPYEWPEAKALLIQIAQGLADAHAAGVFHRDIKPSNVLVGSDGVAKVADFGIALGVDLTRVTSTTTLLGTPAYLPPEGPVDARSDLYSLGIVAYELLTGRPPFGGSTYAEVLRAHVMVQPDLANLPTEARLLVGRLLEKSPVRRAQTAAQLISALEKNGWGDGYESAVGELAVTDSAVSDFAASPAPPKQSRSRRRLMPVGVACLALLLAVGAVVASGLPFLPSAVADRGAGTPATGTPATGAPSVSVATMSSAWLSAAAGSFHVELSSASLYASRATIRATGLVSPTEGSVSGSTGTPTVGATATPTLAATPTTPRSTGTPTSGATAKPTPTASPPLLVTPTPGPTSTPVAIPDVHIDITNVVLTPEGTNQYKVTWDWTYTGEDPPAGSSFVFWDGIGGCDHGNPTFSSWWSSKATPGSGSGLDWISLSGSLSVPVDACSRVDFWIAYTPPSADNLAVFDPDSGAVWAINTTWYGPGS